ncbi:MAG: hypothetical protein ACI39E_07320 [Acutalibacteraceae bacterium]
MNKLLHPPKPVLYIVPPVVFAALIFIFAAEKTESAPAYLIYGMSAYSLSILIAGVPLLVKRIKTWKQSVCKRSKLIQRFSSSAFGDRYLHDPAFRGSIGIYQGVLVNFLYVVFRMAAGIWYASVWFVSIAAYYLALGSLRTYLILSYRRREARGLSFEYRCYRKTAWLLFLLNIPMGDMIVLMVKTDSGFFYPGYVIYLSALYTFYTTITSVSSLVKFRKIGSPILSAAKVLNLVSAMMSILGLQTAMISRFSSNGEEYRTLMNAVTGGCVYGGVILVAVYMLIRSAKTGRKGKRDG